jgi:CHAT domain
MADHDHADSAAADAPGDALDERDAAIAWLTGALDAPDGEGTAIDRLALAQLLIERGEERLDSADVVAGIGHAERSLAGLDGDRYAAGRFILGVGHLVHAQLGAPEDLSVAVGHLREAARLLPGNHPERAGIVARLGVALAGSVSKDLAEGGGTGPAVLGQRLDEAISLLTRSRRECPSADPFSGTVRYWLATALALRFISFAGCDEDARMAMSEFEAALESTSLDPSSADMGHAFVAFLLLTRTAPADMRRHPVTLDAGRIGRMLASASARPSPDVARLALDHLDRVSDMATTGTAYSGLVPWLRSVATAALQEQPPEEELRHHLAAFEEALRLAPEDGAGTTELRGIISVLLGALAAQETGVDAPTGAAESLVTAASQLGAGHPMLPLLRSMLGGAFGVPLGGRQPSAEETEAAAELLQGLLDGIPDDHPARPDALMRLAALLIGRASQSGRSATRLTEARRRLSEAIARPTGTALNDAVNNCLLGMAEGLDGLFDSDMDLMTAGVERLKHAATLAPSQHQLQELILSCLTALFAQRSAETGELEYTDAAIYYAGQLAKMTQAEPASDPALASWQYLLVAGPLLRHPERLDRDRLDKVIGQMESLHAQVPEEHPLHLALAGDLNVFRVLRGGIAPGGGGFTKVVRDPRRIAEAADAAVAAARATRPESGLYPLNLGSAGNAKALQGILLRDRGLIGEGIALLADAYAAAGSLPVVRPRLLGMLTLAVRMRFEITRDRRDLDNLIVKLEEARRLAEEEPEGGNLASILFFSALSYHERNDPNLRDRLRAAEAGLASLRERTASVMLQRTTDRAVDAAVAAEGDAADVARWCLVAEDRDAAVEALERGRSMVLHAATSDADVPVLLRESGNEELAKQWENALAEADKAGPEPWDDLPDLNASPLAPGSAAAWMRPVPQDRMLAGQGPEVRVPSDLRYRVMRTLSGSDLERLLAPPPVTEIAQALRVADAHALVYLLPKDNGAGFALVVDAAEKISVIHLPRLIAGPASPVGDFAAAQLERFGSGQPAAEAPARWQRALGGVCDWAWTSAMDRLLESVGDSARRPARLVLVPVGDLGLVPWHAARRAVAGGDPRYACQDLVLSYAASARQFTEACRRPHRPWRSAPALVRGPGLFFAKEEAEQLHGHHYPEGTLLGGRPGRSPAATPENVRSLLPRLNSPGASLLHLGCHAAPAARPVDGSLILAGGEALSMRQILHQARSRPRDAAGCLIVLAACGTDLRSAHHDEALTLATSFLAAGAVGAVGTRWPVDDLPTLAFTTMFHHYLNSGYDDPSTALRAAQNWMLNPDRPYPGDFLPETAEQVRSADLTQVESWAAFTYQGQ